MGDATLQAIETLGTNLGGQMSTLTQSVDKLRAHGPLKCDAGDAVAGRVQELETINRVNESHDVSPQLPTTKQGASVSITRQGFTLKAATPGDMLKAAIAALLILLIAERVYAHVKHFQANRRGEIAAYMP